MKNLLSASISLAFVALGVTGCKDSCDKACDLWVECLPEQGEEFCDSCKWDDDDDEVMEDCIEACKDSYDDLDGGEKEDVDACVSCIEEDVGSSCDPEKWDDAFDDCEDECDDNDVDEWGEEWFEDWDSEVECENCSGA